MALITILSVNANAMRAADNLFLAQYAAATSNDSAFSYSTAPAYKAIDKALIVALSEILGNKADAIRLRNWTVETSEMPSAGIESVFGYRLEIVEND